MKVVWTDEAKAHLIGIYEYIKRDAPFYAAQTVDKLTRRVDQLIDHPRSGRIAPKFDDENLRELIAHPYRLIYRHQVPSHRHHRRLPRCAAVARLALTRYERRAVNVGCAPRTKQPLAINQTNQHARTS